MTIQPKPLRVNRLPGEFSSDNARVITRFYKAGEDDRMRAAARRMSGFSDDETKELLYEVFAEYSYRHRDLENTLLRRYDQHVAQYVPDDIEATHDRKMLLAAYFTKEYSVESAALFNPCIVEHPNQQGMPAGHRRFVMSFRATGEGHVSSIVFRSGVIQADCAVTFDRVSPFLETTEILKDALYNKRLFELKLNEMHAPTEVSALLFERLPEEFTYDRLQEEIAKVTEEEQFAEIVEKQTFATMRWLAKSNYELRFHEDRDVSERVIFPATSNETNGIEDARFVRFVEDDGAVEYHGTYTAFNGVQILPQLMTTTDFAHFKIVTLNGRMVQNKGMALFPRKINGNYAMVSRQDGVNLFIMFSDHLHFWQEAQLLLQPKHPWELAQIGNCGSPVELDEGWLLLTHGVGPMRKYCIGAVLLDRNDPSKVIAHLPEPIMTPNEYEREGYTPNVLYTCGYLIHQGELIIPYAMSDSRCAVASVSVADLMERMRHEMRS